MKTHFSVETETRGSIIGEIISEGMTAKNFDQSRDQWKGSLEGYLTHKTSALSTQGRQ